MIQEFCDRFIAATPEVKAWIKQQSYPSYRELVNKVIETITPGANYDSPDPTRITVIDHGDYQGTLLFIVGAFGYQPSKYWSIVVSYGSCSGCDTLQLAIETDYGDDFTDTRLTDRSVDNIWTLMLHMVQRMKELE